jgi:hypothetical protein
MQLEIGETDRAKQSFLRALDTSEPLVAFKAATCLAIEALGTAPHDAAEIRRVLTRAVQIDEAAPVGGGEPPTPWTALRFAAARRRPLRSAAALLSVGLMAARDAHFDRAEDVLHQALLVAMRDRDESEQLIRLYVGDVIHRHRGPDEAEPAWRGAFTSGDPAAAPEAAVRLGQLHVARGEPEAAAEMFRYAIASRREHAARSAAVRLALLSIEQGKIADALAALMLLPSANVSGPN